MKVRAHQRLNEWVTKKILILKQNKTKQTRKIKTLLPGYRKRQKQSFLNRSVALKKKCYKAHKDGKRQKVKSRTEVNTHGNYFQNPKARKDPQIL